MTMRASKVLRCRPWVPFPLSRTDCSLAPTVPQATSLSSFCLLTSSLLPRRSVQTFADKSKQEALKNDLVEALKRKQQC